MQRTCCDNSSLADAEAAAEVEKVEEEKKNPQSHP